MSRKTITQPYAEFEEALIAADALKPFIDGSKNSRSTAKRSRR
jgi:hypothetical protein